MTSQLSQLLQDLTRRRVTVCCEFYSLKNTAALSSVLVKLPEEKFRPVCFVHHEYSHAFSPLHRKYPSEQMNFNLNVAWQAIKKCWAFRCTFCDCHSSNLILDRSRVWDLINMQWDRERFYGDKFCVGIYSIVMPRCAANFLDDLPDVWSCCLWGPGGKPAEWPWERLHRTPLKPHWVLSSSSRISNGFHFCQICNSADNLPCDWGSPGIIVNCAIALMRKCRDYIEMSFII